MNVQTDAIHRFESECLLLEVFRDDETGGYCFHAEFKGEGVFERSPYVFENPRSAWGAGLNCIVDEADEFLENPSELDELLAYSRHLDNSIKD